MDVRPKDIKLYRRLRPSRAKVLIPAAIIFIMCAALLAFGGFGVNVRIWQNEDIVGAVLIGGISVAVAVALSAMELRSINRKTEDNYIKLRKLDSIDPYKLKSLDEQLGHTEKLFKTFYMLDEYMYVPKAKLLIRYDDIVKIKSTAVKSVNEYDIARIDITDAYGESYRFFVTDWKSYLKKYDAFFAQLKEKRKNGVEDMEIEITKEVL